jgi:hypothetical protein
MSKVVDMSREASEDEKRDRAERSKAIHTFDSLYAR